MNKRLIFLILVHASFLFFTNRLVAQKQSETSYRDCYAWKEKDTITLGNACIIRTFLWNQGNLVSLELLDVKTQKKISYKDTLPDLFLPNEKTNTSDPQISIRPVQPSAKWNGHLEVIVFFKLGELQIQRLFRIFPQTPAIQSQYFFKGTASSSWINQIAKPGELNNLEVFSQGMPGLPFAPVLEKLQLPGPHWKIRSVRFYDITDRYNNFCMENEELLYRSNIHQGNLAVLENLVNQQRFFILKESPSFYSQLRYPGGDFLSSTDKIQIIGIGLDSADIDSEEWIQGYGTVLGLGGYSELECLSALRSYQKNIFPAYAQYEPIIITNTWGDRGQDRKISEKFLADEIDAAVRLGTNYLQIDDGWESGHSANSAQAGGSFENIWEREGYWNPHPQKFPNGLEPIIAKAKSSNINLSIWFNPAFKDSYASWQKDAEILMNLYRRYGFSIIKIDGLKMYDKKSEQRIRKIFDYVYDSTGQHVSYDLDITAHQRFGYHYFNEYGVYWVANRYTDWRNYYPYTVLRNLWLLSRYVPPEKLQMVFMNIWRNPDKYMNDPLAPSSVSFDYSFATVLMSQPMGFFETSGLPQQAFQYKPLFQEYLKIQKDLHHGIILPVGQEPSGRSWTGFQSILNEKAGYLLVIRELNDFSSAEIKTWLPENTPIKFVPVAGYGSEFVAPASKDGFIKFTLKEKCSWALYKYSIKE